MIDTQGKPTFPADQCPTCAARREARAHNAPNIHCDSCESKIPRYENMSDGYRSQNVDHWHFEYLGGVIGVGAVFRTLCLECYRKDWAEKYPDEECPV